MPVQSSGQVSLNDLHIEAGGTTGTECSFNDSDIRGLISKDAASQMAMNEWYGASNVFTFNITSNTLKGNLSSLATAAGWNGSAALECTINSGVYVWSNSTSTAALIVNVAGAKVTNNGYIMGQGGNGGGQYDGAYGRNGGPAISITASSTTIVNNSGAYIAGGGGGGAAGHNSNRHGDTFWRGGGGGAGGGTGGRGDYANSAIQAGASTPGSATSYGYQAGGGYINRGPGYGGGRVLPGTGGTSGAHGGFWGSNGPGHYGDHPHFSGGSAGAAITGTSRTLTNNGTIYGGT